MKTRYTVKGCLVDYSCSTSQGADPTTTQTWRFPEYIQGIKLTEFFGDLHFEIEGVSFCCESQAHCGRILVGYGIPTLDEIDAVINAGNMQSPMSEEEWELLHN